MYLKEQKYLTYMVDGWEDLRRRSLYGSVAAQVDCFPVILSLKDCTGERGTAVNTLRTMKESLQKMNVEDGKNFVALVTDNPTTMQSFRRMATSPANYPWLLDFACWLHGSNNIVGEVAKFPEAKKVISKNTVIVSFFNGSHYWGGQLMDDAKTRQPRTRSLKQNCETRWYAITLQALSIESMRYSLQAICVRRDAQKSMKGLSAVKKEVIDAVFDDAYWIWLDQIIRVTKPIVDMIGNLESRSCTLADCVLEAIRCGKEVAEMTAGPDESVRFLMHAKSVFNRRIAKMITPVHVLALFLHPLCRSLAISKATSSGYTLESLTETALGIVHKWKYKKGLSVAHQLVKDMHEYHKGKGIWAGGKADALTWWHDLAVREIEHPLKTLALILHSIVPHTAEVERLFSQLGGVQTAKRCNLSVETFESLGKCRSHYSRQQWDEDRARGKPRHRQAAHMHTRPTAGVDADLVQQLDSEYGLCEADVDNAPDTEQFALSELEKAFERLSIEAADTDEEEEGQEMTEGSMFDFGMLDAVARGETSSVFDEEAPIDDDSAEATWDVKSMMADLYTSV
ncbi:ribonuclease H-like domain-containing protein [Schizophyllum commune]